MSELEKETADYLDFLMARYGQCDIELVLPKPIFRGLLNELRMTDAREAIAYEYDRFTWNTPLGVIVVHLAPYPSTKAQVVPAASITDNSTK